MIDSRLLGRLRQAALIAVLGGAGGSFALMLYAGRRNHSWTLLALMAIWVLSPFIALGWANLRSTRWAVLTRATLYSVTLLLSLASSTVYFLGAFNPPKAQAASVFVIVPPVSWLLIALVISLAALVSRRP